MEVEDLLWKQLLSRLDRIENKVDKVHGRLDSKVSWPHLASILIPLVGLITGITIWL